jgi:hypothetical protein
MHRPLLSVVATSRNDNHGKNLHYRMQMFVDGFVAQCKKHDLSAELILVEWNPPSDTLPLAQVLQFPQDKGPCSIRIIRVPPEVHETLAHSDRLPLFQMIGKNVGIRRAKGEFILATNIDILFSDQLMQFMKHQLAPDHLYRVDRLDVPEKLPSADSFDKTLQFCFQSFFRINGRMGTTIVKKVIFKQKIAEILKKFQLALNEVINVFSSNVRRIHRLSIKHFIYFTKKTAEILKKFQPINLIKFLYRTAHTFLLFLKQLIKHFFCFIYPQNSLFLHTNACGDFTLLSQNSWHQLKGYPEWPMYSWHLDSVLLHQAHQHGIKHRCLPLKMSIFHIEHDLGSGYSPEGAHLLFERLKSKGIPHLSNIDLENLVTNLKKSKVKATYNDDNWGMADRPFEEIFI